MMRFKILVAAAMLSALAFSFRAKDAKPRLIWSDEFDKDGAPGSSWVYDLGDGCPRSCGWGNNELQQYTSRPENVRVQNGKLIIEAHKSEGGYSSTRIKSGNGNSWRYGYIEVKAKLPQGRGTWPAIWMLPDSSLYGGWPRSGEIDIMEHVGFDPGVVHGTVHTDDFNHIKGTQVGKQKQVSSFNSKFHVYAVNWTNASIEFFIDGQHYHTFTNNGNGVGAWPFDKRFHLIMNIAVGGGWGGMKGVDENIWPQRMEVDYVRVYEPLTTPEQRKAIFKK